MRLLQGRADAQTVYSDNPAEVAEGFARAGAKWVHVVDLDGAFTGQPANRAAVRAIAGSGLRVQLGGGLRNEEAVAAALDDGASRVVIGTKALERKGAFLRELVGLFGSGQVAVGVDAKDGKVAVKGWAELTEVSAAEVARWAADAGAARLIYTDIATDGMLRGPNFEAIEALLKVAGIPVIASGGVSGENDILRLSLLAKQSGRLEGVIVGKAIYEGRVDLRHALEVAGQD